MTKSTPNSLMLNDFRIEKSLLPVTIVLVDGQTLAGDVFIQASARHRFEMEDASEVMNAGETFFPLRLDSGSTLLVAKKQVRDVHVAAEYMAEPDWNVSIPTPVNIQLRDGTIFDGMLCIESMTGRTRVLDYLNRITDRFLPLYRTEGLVLVSFSQIVHVRQLNDEAA
ncbi:MAG: hypothetical protein ABI877_00920 [Gemmatimonadaceae bacterium]